MRSCALLFGFFIALTCVAQAQDALKITIPTVTAPPKVDGTLGDPIWQQAAKV